MDSLYIFEELNACKTADKISRHLKDTLPVFRIELRACCHSTPWAHKSAIFPEGPHNVLDYNSPAVQKPI